MLRGNRYFFLRLSIVRLFSCIICNELVGESSVSTKCGNVFHLECINKRNRSGEESCIICRAPIHELIKLYPTGNKRFKVIPAKELDSLQYDFFLVSQHVRQGTVTPTHYQVIEDTLRLPPDIMQRLTFKLTHMFYNWSGTVRVPAPCQLAHKLAFLTGQTLGRSPHTGLDELLYFL